MFEFDAFVDLIGAIALLVIVVAGCFVAGGLGGIAGVGL